MNYIKTDIPDVWILEPRVFEDARGYFMETWREEDFNRGIGHEVHFVQDNQSMSSRGVLRGLHFQKGDDSQAKVGSCFARLRSGCRRRLAKELSHLWQICHG